MTQASAALTTPQRNCLLAVFLAHPEVYVVRGAALLPQRLVKAGLVDEIEGYKKVRRFRLTPEGVTRATKLAARRDADHGHADVISGGLEGKGSPARCDSAPPGWVFPSSAHAWAR